MGAICIKTAKNFFYKHYINILIAGGSMNFKINNNQPAFKAKYTVWGKQTKQETDDVYAKKIKILERNRQIAAKAQEYMLSEDIQKAISYLPEDTFVRLHTGVYDGEGKSKDDILGFSPFLSFEQRQKVSNKEILKLSLEPNGDLNTARIDNWFTELLDVYC